MPDRQHRLPRWGVAVAAVLAAVGLGLGAVLALPTAGPVPVVTPEARKTPAMSAPPTAEPTPTAPAGPAAPGTGRDITWASRLGDGPWPTSHVQGMAVDPQGGHIYYSFTTMLVKTDLKGKVLGTVRGFTGHLGDLDFNPADHRLYGSLEYKPARAFYIAIFDVDKIDRIGMQAQNSPVLNTVYMPEVVSDFTADLDGNGVFAGDTADTLDHRYGCSGIDGLAFGPAFGSTSGPQYLTVAYGVYNNRSRTDNDHQVFLQYDIGDWARYARPLIEGKAHRTGPVTYHGKYFVYTGNTTFGVQSLDYDPEQQLWLFSVYPGTKAAYPNYALFAVSASARPTVQSLRGLGGERGAVLPLADLGLRDRATGVRGWRFSAPFGLQALGDGNYYVVSSRSGSGGNSARLTLWHWTGQAARPFALGPARK